MAKQTASLTRDREQRTFSFIYLQSTRRLESSGLLSNMGCCSCLSKPTTKDAYRLSTASLIFAFWGSYVAVLLYLATGSSLCLVFGMENIVDFLSSLVVLWRFFAPDDLTERVERQLENREERASVAISFAMVLLGLFVTSTAIHDARRGPEEAIEYKMLWILSFMSLFVFSVLTLLKLTYSKALNCDSLYKDGICSLIGASLSLAILINTWIVARVPIMWWIDPLAAFCAGMVALGLGLLSISEAIQKGTPIFQGSWWSQDKEDDVASNDRAKGPDIEVVDLSNEGAATQCEKQIV